MKKRQEKKMSKNKGSRAQKTLEQALPNEEANGDGKASTTSLPSYSDSETSSNRMEGANDGSASLEVILQELKASRRDNENNFQELKEELKIITGRMTEAEGRISELDDRAQRIEEATIELIKIQDKLEAKVADLEGRSRRDNLRFHGIAEGSENNSTSVSSFLEDLIKAKLNIPPTLEVSIERAHRSLGPKPPPDAPPRSIVAKFSSFKAKEEILRLAWQMKGFMSNGKRVIVDHDYAPDVLKQRREYSEAKKILKENKIRFQTPYPARMRVFYDGETCLYNNAAEATEDMVKRGLTVSIIRSRTSWAEKIRGAMWRTAGRAGQADQRTQQHRNETGYKKRLEVFRRDTI